MRIVLTTCRRWPDLSVSDRLLHDELRDRGHDVAALAWNVSPITEFAGADVVILRSNWDYHGDLEGFDGWLAELERAGPSVLNPPPLVRWSLFKTYLFDLRDGGLPVPETVAFDRADPAPLIEWATGRDRFVIKPLVGASGHGVRLVHGHELDTAVRGLRDEGASGGLMAQAFVADSGGGEWALVYFGGRLHHAFRRVPAPGEFRVNSQYGGTVRSGDPGDALVRLGASAVDALPMLPVYARVDVVDTAAGPTLMEVELNEPALGLHLHPRAPQRFADAILDAVAAGPS